MINFLKGIATGLGAIAPGLSGSVLLVIFGLYRKTIAAINDFFRLKNIGKNFRFLAILGCGILIGAVLFSKLVDFLLVNFEMYTRFAFLGLILGTIPLFFREVRKEGFSPKYYIFILAAFCVGIFLFVFNRDYFPPVEDPDIWQSVVLGLAVAVSYIVPGVDSAAILSALGFYDLWVSSVAHFNFEVLIPAGVGAVIGVIIISLVINKLIANFYTATFSTIFGLFLSVIPSVLSENSLASAGVNIQTLISVILMAAGFVLSILFGNLEKLSSEDGEDGKPLKIAKK